MITGQQVGKWEAEVEYLQNLLKESIAEREKLSEENRRLRTLYRLCESVDFCKYDMPHESDTCWDCQVERSLAEIKKWDVAFNV